MSELSQIVAAVAENRMSAQEAYQLLRSASEPDHQQVVRVRTWSRTNTVGPGHTVPGAWGLVLVAPGSSEGADVWDEVGNGAATVVHFPESAEDPEREFDEFWAGWVAPLLDGQERVSVVFQTPGQTTTNPDTSLLFMVSRALLRGRPDKPVQLVCHIWRDDPRALAWAQACGSLMACVEMENPHLTTAVVWTPQAREVVTDSRIVGAVQTAVDAPAGRVVRIGSVGEVDVLDAVAPAVLHESAATGVDLEQTAFFITGGSGGLARLMGDELVRRGAAAVVLNGRRSVSDLDPELRELINGSDGRIRYVEATLTSPQDCLVQLSQAKGEARRLCVLHCAGVRNDAFLIKQDLALFMDTIAPKTDLTDHLVTALGHIPDAVLVGFSSVTGLLGNIGQSSYAFANGYMDGLAVAEADRNLSSRVLSIAWPLWDEGGMQLDGQARQRMLSSTGMVPLGTDTGVDFLLDQIRCGARGSQALLQGMIAQIERTLAPMRTTGIPESITQTSNSEDIDPEELHRKTCRFLVGTISGVTEIPAADIHLDEPFDQFGLDSIVAMRIGDDLERHFDGLPKTLLFEYQNINELAGYFVAHHGADLQELLGLEARVPSRTTVAPILAEPAEPVGAQHHPASVAPAAQTPIDCRSISSPDDNRIAIVGMAGRYPQAESVDAFWHNLVNGVDSITEIPEDRWDCKEFFSPKKGELGRIYSRWGGFLDGVDQFDPRLFHINVREAMIMDPQERLFLEIAWTAVEDAGYRPSELRGRRIGVFAGAMYTEYQMLPSQTNGRVIAHTSLHSSIANRVSYYLDLTGPSVALDTMCSSSLVAVHYACRSILDGEAEMAIAGGVNVSLTPEKYLFLSQSNFLSSDGRCRAFGHGGDGYVPSEGVGAVILKRFTDAVADGDHIYAIIRGSAVNHDGKTSGYTVPNPNSQADVISRALAAGRVDPAEVSYIEAHGTGTELGDPIEVSALSQVFDGITPVSRATRAIGSVKSNIGHAESAAGIASLTKVVLQMRHGELVPSIHTEQLNPIINFAGHGFTVQRAHEPWDVAAGARRVAGISCFGAGGTNAHVVVEEYPQPDMVREGAHRVFVPFSSASEDQLRRLLENFVQRFSGPQSETLRLSDIAYTMQRGRELMAVRLIVFASTVEELLARIMEFLENWSEGPEIIYRPTTPADPDADFFFGGRQGRELIAGLVAQGQLDQLARIWLKGYPIEVERLYDSPRRIPLPTHIFDHASYWIPQQEASQRGHVSELLDANESDLDGTRFTTTFEVNSGAKGGYVSPDGQVSPLAGAAVVEDAFTHLTGEKVGAIHFLRLQVRSQGRSPLSYTVRAARGGLGVILEATGPDGVISFQASVSAASPRPEQFLADFPTDNQWRRHSIDIDALAVSSPLAQVLAGALQVVDWGDEHPGLLEVQDLQLLATGVADTVVEYPAVIGQGRDLEFYESGSQRLIARAVGVTLTREADQDTGLLPIRTGCSEAVSQNDDVADFILDISTELFGLPRERLDLGVPFDEYGMDSVLIGRFAERIRSRFPDIKDTVFFDHDTIGSLIDHITEQFPPVEWRQAPRVEPTQPEPEEARTSVTVNRAVPRIASLIHSSETVTGEPIAIIGMSGVFPEAPDLASYWANLLAGRESIGLIPSDRWDYRRYFDSEIELPRPGTSYAPWGGFVDDPFGFDNRFFNITPADAIVIDPQERMLLETVWHTLEDAGLPRGVLRRGADDELGEDVGVFVGTTSQTYQFWGVEQALGENPVLTNSSPWSLANRISYFFDFSGPSLPIDTACSSGLSAVHLAVESIRCGECSSAIAAGVNLFLHPLKYASMCQMKMLSPTGRLSAFGAAADGFVPGEGVAAVLLKSLSRAIADGDRIRAVIRSSAVNHGGRTNGYTVPSVSAQSRLLRRAWQRADVEPGTIGYLEMHGTGTRLGDPIEVEAAGRAMRATTDHRKFCAIGSVKPNIGHLESCSGLASLIKVVRQLETGMFVPSINASPRNPRLDLEASPFFITEQPMPWQPDPRSTVRRAGISSFGAGGSNAHIVVESFEAHTSRSTASGPQLIVLSARTPDRLPLLAEQLADHLASHPDTVMEELAWTLQTGREVLPSKLAFLAVDQAHCLATLRELATGADPAAVGETGEWPQLAAIANSWMNGAEVDWATLHPQPPRRISLPGYRFDHNRFVVERGCRTPLSAVEAERVACTVRERREDLAVDPELRDVHPQTSAHVAKWQEWEGAGQPKSWEGRRVVLLIDPSHTDLAELLRAQLQAIGAELLDEPGDGCTDIIWMQQPRRLGSDDLWDETALAREQEDRLVALLEVVRSIGARDQESGCDIHLVTDRVQDLAGRPVRPYGSGGSALVRSAAKEIAGLRGVAIDFDMVAEQTRLTEVCDTILSIGVDKDVEEVIVRDGRVRVLRLTSAKLPLAEQQPTAPGSVQVIVGGLGSVGFAYAEHLVHTHGARVCLVGRSPLNSAKRAMLERLGDEGIHYLYRAVDATDSQAVGAVLAEVEQRWGAVDTLVHSAMVFDETPVAELTAQTFVSVLRPKTRALQAILKAIRSREIGRVLAFSSSQAYLGSRNRAHYAAACAGLQSYLNAMRAELGVPIHRIDWGFWGTDKGRPIDREFSDFLSLRGIRPITAVDGMDIIDRVIANQIRELTVIPVSDRVRSHLPILTSTDKAPVDADTMCSPDGGLTAGSATVATPPELHPVVALPTSPAATITSPPGNEGIETRLISLLAQVIGASPADVDPTASFMDIGLDSISGLRFVHAVNETLAIDLGDTVVFDHPTIATLAEHIQETHSPVLALIAEPETDEVLAVFKQLESREITPDEVMARGGDDSVQ